MCKKFGTPYHRHDSGSEKTIINSALVNSQEDNDIHFYEHILEEGQTIISVNRERMKISRDGAVISITSV